MENYYLIRGGQEFGPYSGAQLAEMWDEGQITADMSYRRESGGGAEPIESLFIGDFSADESYVPMEAMRPAALRGAQLTLDEGAGDSASWAKRKWWLPVLAGMAAAAAALAAAWRWMFS